jgi:hypothetical protein
MVGGVLEETRLARLGIRHDGDAPDPQALVASLDDRLHAVAELCDDVEPE